MRWKEFLNKRQMYEEVWAALKSEYDGDIRNYLNRSRLVIAYGPGMAGQFDAKNKDVGSIAIDHSDFFIRNASGDRLVELAKQYKAIRDQDNDLKPEIIKQLELFNTEFLDVVENQPEIRFPELNIEFIQEVKNSKYCDKKMTSMSKSSIRVVLRIDE